MIKLKHTELCSVRYVHVKSQTVLSEMLKTTLPGFSMGLLIYYGIL